MDTTDKLLTTVYTVRFGRIPGLRTTCLNVGACCLRETMKSPGAEFEHEASRRRYNSDEVCEMCDKVIERELDSEVEY